jgi:hypothetical protein
MTVGARSTRETPEAPGPEKVGLANSGLILADLGSARTAKTGGVGSADIGVGLAD